jgi:acyl dehydratase
MEVTGMRERSDGSGVVDFKFEVINQEGQPVLVNNYQLLMRKQPGSIKAKAKAEAEKKS